MTVAFDAPHIGLVVEGPGDRGAVPVLLRNYLHSVSSFRDVFSKPVTLKGKGAATRPNGIEGFVQAAARPGATAVMVFLDADKDDPRVLGPQLLARATPIVHVPVSVCVAEVDFEDWLYGSIETLALGVTDFDPTARGKAEIVRSLRPEAYSRTVWQPKLASRVDATSSRSRNRSLDRALTRLDQLVGSLP